MTTGDEFVAGKRSALVASEFAGKRSALFASEFAGSLATGSEADPKRGLREREFVAGKRSALFASEFASG